MPGPVSRMRKGTFPEPKALTSHMKAGEKNKGRKSDELSKTTAKNPALSGQSGRNYAVKKVGTPYKLGTD